MEKLAWHYTTGAKLDLILASGLLKTSRPNIGGRQTERPLVWFTINQRWEPSASYTGVRNGTFFIFTMQETREAGKGLVRLGYPKDSLTSWLDTCKLARIKSRTQRNIEKMGMIPYQWMGYFSNIPVTDLVIEVMNDDLQWERRELASFQILAKEDADRYFIEMGYSSTTAPTLGLEE